MTTPTEEPMTDDQLALWLYERKYPPNVRPHGGARREATMASAVAEFGELADAIRAVVADPATQAAMLEALGLERQAWWCANCDALYLSAADDGGRDAPCRSCGACGDWVALYDIRAEVA